MTEFADRNMVMSRCCGNDPVTELCHFLVLFPEHIDKSLVRETIVSVAQVLDAKVLSELSR